jgi:DNA-binding GntR family transcriptional regulator
MSADQLTTGSRRAGTLSDRAYTEVREAILRGEIPTGSVLGETELAHQIGISRTPVRHALGRLLQEGLLEPGPRRQVIVRGFTPQHRAEIRVLREAIEAIAVTRACEELAPEEIDYLRLLLIRQRRLARENRQDEFIEVDEELHLKIAEGARLPILLSFLSQLRGFVRVARIGVPRSPDVLKQIVDEHERIVDALERRDPDRALTALVEHLHKSDYDVLIPQTEPIS